MKLNHIRDVVAVAERGSLRGAARQLGIAQPAITRSIREIEHELGVALFERRARGVTLTPMGERFLRRAVAAQSELRQARDEIEQLKGATTGQVSIALSIVPHIALLPRALAPFRSRYPDVALKVTEALFPTIEGALKEGAIDFYVGPLPERAPGKEFAVEKLFDNTGIIFGRKGHALARAKSLRELTGANWIITSVMMDRKADLSPLFDQHGLPRPHVAMEASSALTMIIAAANSDLLMILPEQWLDLPSTPELLDAFQIEEPLPAPPICMVSRARLPPTPAAEYFADRLRRASSQLLVARADRQRAPTAPHS